MLTLTDVSYVLPDKRRLFESINLSVAVGDAVVIEGPSGTGKSTLLAIIGGLLQPTSGSVTVDPPWDTQRVAWVLQSLNSLSARTTLDNAALYNLIDGATRSAALQSAAEGLTKLGLGKHLDKRVRLLSGGELQRVAAARAVGSLRPLVLADEPTNQLDRANAKRVMSALIDSANSGRAVVIVTHDLDAVAGKCRILRLSEKGLHERSRTA